MAGVGDAKAHKYVMKEMIRRTMGITGKREDKDSKAISGAENLKNWHHLKTPWIRMCSNAVPKLDKEGTDISQTYAEAETTNELFGGGAPTNETRFQHVLYGGIGQIKPETTVAGGATLGLSRNFSQTYINPFQYSMDDESKMSPLENRLRPSPGITNIEVTYKGDMGALKKAVVSFKCHTLDDLERMEKYYMYPGFKVLLEWGWSINTAGSEFTSTQIPGVTLSDDTLKFPGKVYREIQENKLASGGCYDGLFGTIVNFSWTINKDKSFDCTTTIADIGDSIFTANVNTPFHNLKMTAADEAKLPGGGFTLTSALEVISKKLSSQGSNNTISEFTIDFKESIGPLKCKFYRLNTGDTSKASEENDRHRKKQLYVRFGDIVDRLCNKLYCLTSNHTRAEVGDNNITPPIAMLSIGGSPDEQDAGLSAGPIKVVEDVEKEGEDATTVPKRPISIISNHPQLLSCDPGVCLLPNQVGITNKYDASEKSKVKKYVPTGLKGEGVDFNVPDTIAKEMGAIDYNRESEFGAGFLANIFVNIDVLLEKAESASSLADFLNGVTTDINYSCANIWAFQWRMDDQQPGYMTCVDRNFSWSGKVQALEFGVDNLSSLVKSLSMKSSISSQMTNALYIAANTPFTGATVKKGELSNKNIIPLVVDFEVDGVSGLQFGTTMAIDYLPKRYRSQTYLFAEQVQHSVSPNSWNTTITAGFRWAPIEAKLNKIRLSQIPYNLNGGDEEAILAAISGEATNVGEGEDLETTGAKSNNGKLLPGSMFASLESEGLVMGGDGIDPNEGMEVQSQNDQQENQLDLIDTQSDLMAGLYYTGGTISDISDANTNLNKIIYYSEADGTAPPRTEVQAAAKIKRAAVIRSTQTYTPPPLPINKTDIDENGQQKRAVNNGNQIPLGVGDMF